MKRFAIATAAALTLVGPLAATSAYADPPRHHRDYDRNDRDGRYQQRGWQDNGRHWRRGERVSSYQREHFRQVDWRREHLREPPRGYRYVRDDNSGETLLIGLATGAILGVILASQ